MESLFKPSFPHFYRKRSGGRDVSARATHLKAELGNVSISTTERKQMSSKTTFKRIALVAVAALGLGVLSVAPSQAALVTETITLGATTATVTQGDTATTTITHQYSSRPGNARDDSATVLISCTAPASAVCPTLASTTGTTLYWTATPDSNTATTNMQATSFAASSYTDSALTAGVVRSVVGMKFVSSITQTVGVYTINVYSRDANGVYNTPSATWSVTVVADNTTATTLARKYIAPAASDAQVWAARGGLAGIPRASSDSAVVCAAGLASVNTPCAVALVMLGNSAGETKTAVGNLITNTVSVTITGAGVINTSNSQTTGTSSASLVATNGANAGLTNETVTVLSNGNVGVATITFASSAGVTLGSFTVTFTGTPASAAIALSDTIVSLTAGSTIVGTVKDSGGNVMKSGTVYVYSSDTKVAGTNLSTNVHPAVATSYTIPSTGVLAYPLTTTDTGVATITLRDSWTVAASTWTSNEVVVDVRGSTIVTLTVAFDKATYSPGERAVITYTAKDSAGKGSATAALTGLTALSNATMADVIIASITGTNGGTGNFTVLGGSFNGYLDTGVETRVVTMPTYAGAVNLTNTFATFGSTTGAKTTVTATATVVDPNAAAIAAAKDASDAATDAALEATDAAYAATDAANIAAEAADAATAAAEAATEAANAAKDSADAATAAVEELATSVAKLMAALQAQITTLAKVVAKIAVKVKA